MEMRALVKMNASQRQIMLPNKAQRRRTSSMPCQICCRTGQFAGGWLAAHAPGRRRNQIWHGCFRPSAKVTIRCLTRSRYRRQSLTLGQGSGQISGAFILMHQNAHLRPRRRRRQSPTHRPPCGRGSNFWLLRPLGRGDLKRLARIRNARCAGVMARERLAINVRSGIHRSLIIEIKQRYRNAHSAC